MSDFFGGILDNIRGAASDFPSLGVAIANSITYGSAQQNSYSKLEEAHRLSTMYDVPDNKHYAPTANVNRANESQAQDFEHVEQSWLQRLHRFAQIDSGLSAGKVNEGADR